MNQKATPMNCAQFDEIFHDLDRPETLEIALFEAAMDHAESCTRCARLLDESESLSLSLRALAAEDAGDEAPARTENTLINAFKTWKSASKMRMVHARVAALGIAASVLLVVGIALHHQRTSPVSSPAPKPDVATALAQTPASDSSPAQASQQQIPAGEQDDSEYATNFVSLPYADDPATIEDGAIVRVTLPRSALASFGLPVVDDGSADQIPADLIVSSDGTPEAIRLVSLTNANGDY
jgi:hypothetical protein